MVIDGRTIANHILEDLEKRVYRLQENYQVTPHMAVIRVGDNEATTSYIAQKQRMAKRIGAIVSVYNHERIVTQEQLQNSVDFLQQDSDIHGIILQLPIPKTLDPKKIIDTIQPEKDIDGFVTNSPFIVPLAAAVMKILEIVYIQETKATNSIDDQTFDTSGSFITLETLVAWLQTQSIVIMGKGPTGGLPILQHLKKLGLQPQMIDSQTIHPEEITKKADIIISAVGKYGIVKGYMLKKECILIGIGMDQDEEGKFYGDYIESDIKDIAKYYTPIPGGVGPVNAACLLENLVIATEKSVHN